MKTTFKPIQSSTFSISYSISPVLNYLLVEEVIKIKTSYNSGIEYSALRGQKELKHSHELSFEEKEQSFDFIKEHVFSKEHLTKYKYFRIVFANKTEIICTSFEEFLETVTQL